MQITVTNAEQSLSEVARLAQQEPVTLQEDGRDVAVVLSPEDYRRLKASELEDFSAFCARSSAYAKSQGMTEEVLAKLLADDDE